MKDFLSNVWVKRAVSVFNVAYFAVITLLTYDSVIMTLKEKTGQSNDDLIARHGNLE